MVAAPQAQGEEAGRYQCVSLGTSDAVFIIDTREGHVWTWTGNPRIEHEGYVGIIYQGKVRPGNKTGTLIGEIDPSKR
jgi:hypothetical protein